MKLMKRKILEKLEPIKQFPCVSLLMRTNRRPQGYRSDSIRLKKLIAEMEKRLEGAVPVRRARRLASKMKNLAATVDFRYLDCGLCLFVSENVEAIRYLPSEVEDRVVIGNEFALKEILIDLRNKICAVMLVVSDEGFRVMSNEDGLFCEVTQTYDDELRRADGPGSTERVISSSLANNAWFPGRTKGPVGRAPLPGAYVLEENSVQQERRRQFFRHVDSVFTKMLPADAKVILCGSPHQTALFEETCSNGKRIIAKVNGNFIRHSESELRAIAEEKVETIKHALTESALEELLDHGPAPEIGFGIKKIWQLAQQKPLAALFIEENFSFPATVHRKHGIVEASSTTDPLKVMDATEELVKLAYSTGAQIYLCRSDRLKESGRIAARFNF